MSRVLLPRPVSPWQVAWLKLITGPFIIRLRVQGSVGAGLLVQNTLATVSKTETSERFCTWSK